MHVDLVILNYNGRRLLPECLPSVLRAAEVSRYPCRVTIIDNASTDDSLAWLAEHYPQVPVEPCPNRGLCSFNDVVPRLGSRIAVLLNNDIKLHADSIDPLVEPLLDSPACFMTAPKCWQFDAATYEGFKTAIQWRWGLIQATALFDGHQEGIDRPGLTASAGAAMAVDRRKFVELGGFDPLYLPGRLEDLDFALRGYQAGYHARYVPESVAYHRGMATFAEAFGPDGCDRLALRNTLLFQWKNLRHPLHVVRHLAAIPLRLAQDVCRAPMLPRSRRWAFAQALFGALRRLPKLRTARYRTGGTIHREREFFHRFHPSRMNAAEPQSNYRRSVSPRLTSPSLGETRLPHVPLQGCDVEHGCHQRDPGSR